MAEGYADPVVEQPVVDQPALDSGPAPGDGGGGPTDQPPVIDPRAFQSLYEANQRYQKYGDPDEIGRRLEQLDKLQKVFGPDQGPKLSERDKLIQTEFARLEPWAVHGRRLTPEHLDLLDLLQKQRPYLESLPQMARSTAVTNEYSVAQAEGALNKLAEKSGLDAEDTSLLHEIIGARIMRDPRVREFYVKGGVEEKTWVINKLAPDAIKLFKRNAIRADAGKQGALEAIAGLTKAPGKGAPAGPTAEPESDDLASAHQAFMKDMAAAGAE